MHYGVKLISPAESSSFVQRDTGLESFYRRKECRMWKVLETALYFFQSLLTLEDKKRCVCGGGDPMVPCAQLHKSPTADRIRAQCCICMLRTKACTIATSSIYKPTRLQFLCVQLEIKISGQRTTWSRWCHTLPPHQLTLALTLTHTPLVHTHTHTHWYSRRRARALVCKESAVRNKDNRFEPASDLCTAGRRGH